VRELLPRAKGFFENVLSAYCGLQYQDVSLLDRISDSEVRNLIKGARTKFAGGDKPGAMTDLKVALHKLENPEDRRLSKLHAPPMPTLPAVLKNDGFGKNLEQIHSFLAACASRTNALMFGIDPIRYANFVRQGPGVVWASNGSHQAQHWSTYEDVTTEMFEELVSFLIDYGLRVNGAYIPAARILVRGANGVSLE
jgi:hypothetical protein